MVVFSLSQNVITTEDAKKTSIDDLFNKLSASKKGLSSSEAEKRLQQFGPNEIPEKKVNPLLKFLSYFWGPIPFMIEAAVVMSAILRDVASFGIILLLLIMNAVVGFWEERQAGNAIEALQKRLSPTARVLRDGEWIQIPSKDLVPGDNVRVRLGDIIPADLKLIEGDYLQADESALTGESLPVEKNVADIAYSSSIVKQGEMEALVVTTGPNTFFGKTTKLVEEAKTSSHFQRAVVRIGDYLIVLAIVLVAIIIFVSIFRHEAILTLIQFSLVLIVASIPAALPAVLSVTMAIGAIALSKKEAIVSRMVAIEEMAGMDVLCADKTGTITENKLTVGELRPYGKYTENDILLYGTLASREEDKDPIDDAIIKKTRNIEVAKNLNQYKVTKFKPFDPVVKRTVGTIEDKEGNEFTVAKGAPQVILDISEDKEKIKDQIGKDVDDFAAKGYRALGVAKTIEKNKWQYVGLIALHDPPREDSGDTIKSAEDMGVKVKMVTGDHIAIGKEIAKEVGLGTDIALPDSFVDKPNRKAQRIVEEADGFAEVFPEHKYEIVENLQNNGHIVGMTGDGVNDAPALKKADSGIAVTGATDAARSAADIVLTKPGLSVIIDAIKEARQIFQRMQNYSVYRIAETIRVVLFITLTITLFDVYPITAVMIVLLALLNDLPIITIAYDNVRYSKLPEKWKMRTVLGLATLLGTVGVIISFGAFYIGKEIFQLSPEVLQAFIYLKLSLASQMTLLIARTKGPFWSIRPAKQLGLAVFLSQTTAVLITVYGVLFPAPLGWLYALFIIGYVFLGLLITDPLKVLFYKLLDHSGINFHR
jgi:H+-transporting ATPase